MPTGYTAELFEREVPFEEFVLTCARAFGATILMRDDPLSTPIPDEFQPSDYHLKALEGAKKELARLQAMTNEQRIAFGTQKGEDAFKRAKEYAAKCKAQNDRLLDMQAKVRDWTPPTPDHTELQAFMLQQLEISMHSMDDSFELKAPMEYYAEAVKNAEHGIDYHRKGYAEEVERTSARNKWIRELRESLREKIG